MTRIFYASTLFGAMTLAAAAEAGLFGPHDGRRLLLVSCNAAVPEVATPPHETDAFAVLRRHFDDIRSWNEIIAPLHPAEWRARIVEVPMLARLLTHELGLDGPPEELVLESVAVPPARTIAALIRDCPVTVYADGLMSYGPTRDPLPQETSGRITRLIHPDLVPGLVPLLLREYGVPAVQLPDDAFTTVVERVAGRSATPDGAAGGAMIVGQYLSALGVLTPAEEAGLYAGMLRGLAARGHTRIVFKPHPAAGREHARLLRREAERLGVRLAVAGEPVPAEACLVTSRPELVTGCFSTALATARRYFGIPVATMGCDLVLERLAPYENSNRIPATVVDATVPRLTRDGALEDPPLPPSRLPSLVRAVGYCMRGSAHPDLREAAREYIDEHGADRYFKRRRLDALGLPGDAPEATPSPGPLRRLQRRLTSRR